MKIRIENNTNNKLIWVTVNCSNVEEIELRRQFYKKILLSLLDGNSIMIITIEPQDYSVAYSINPHQLRKIKGKNFLVNSILKCDLELVEKIVSSEEFERALLLIVNENEQSLLSDKTLIDILGLIKGKFIDEPKEVIYCDADGDSLCLCNTTIDFKKLISESQRLTADLVTEIL